MPRDANDGQHARTEDSAHQGHCAYIMPSGLLTHFNTRVEDMQSTTPVKHYFLAR